MHATARFVTDTELEFTLHANGNTYAGKATLADADGNKTCQLEYFGGKPALLDKRTGAPVEPDVYVMAAVTSACVGGTQ